MENLQITGALGPIRELPHGGMEIRPFTIFIGKQGTGKSLVSQLAYFFRNLPFLVRYHESRLGPDADESEIVNTILNNLRSAGGEFSTFADMPSELTTKPVAIVGYNSPEKEPSMAFEVKRTELPLTDSSGFQLNFRGSSVRPRGSLQTKVARIRAGKQPVRWRAVYVPTERVLYSHARGPSVWQAFSFPSSLLIFADMMDEAASTFKSWRGGTPDTEEGRWVRERGRKALVGEVYRRGEAWKWKVDQAKEIDVDMASSGQKANWPLVLLSEALFSWRKERLIESPFYVHVEEPEIHLHPEAQVAIVSILAYLVNQGFKVLITTHSPTVLYTVNNLLVASALEETVKEPGIPQPEVRLKRGDVGAYLFREDGAIESLVGEETGLLSEEHLTGVDEQLGIELNRLEYLQTYGV